MPEFLDGYGVSDARRERAVKAIVSTVAITCIVGSFLYFWFYNYKQEKQVDRFFDALRGGRYEEAYAVWGCTKEKPCKEYPYRNFLEDWGPASKNANPGSMSITRSRSCGTGVIITAAFSNHRAEKLWVERNDLTIGFSPWPGCPPR